MAEKNDQATEFATLLLTHNLRPWDGRPETFPVEAKFRTRVSNGSLGLAIKLQPTAQILRDAWYTITQAVSGQAGKPVLAVQ